MYSVVAEEIQSTGVVLSYFFTYGVPYFLFFFSRYSQFDLVNSLYFFLWDSWDKFPLLLYSFVLSTHYSWSTTKLSFHSVRSSVAVYSRFRFSIVMYFLIIIIIFIFIIIIITILFIYLFITRLWPSGIVFCWFHVWINLI